MEEDESEEEDVPEPVPDKAGPTPLSMLRLCWAWHVYVW